MYHSIKIGNKDLFADFGLVPVARPVVAMPKPKTSYVDVSGVDGALDLSETLAGMMLYANREGTWEFMAANRYRDPKARLHELSNFLHGRYMRVILEDDPGYYYMGRLTVRPGKLDRGFLRVTIAYNLEPYKYELTSSTEDWLWDPFSFETGIIREYGSLTVDGTLAVTVAGSARPSIPTITCSAAMTVAYKGTTYNLAAGANRLTDIVIGENEAVMTFTGSGTVSIDYRGGWL